MKTINTAMEAFDKVKDALEAEFGKGIDVRRINDLYLSFEEKWSRRVTFSFLKRVAEITGNDDICVKDTPRGTYTIECRF